MLSFGKKNKQLKAIDSAIILYLVLSGTQHQMHLRCS